MITKNMIKLGFAMNLISIENEYNGCTSLCCKIGREAFYFVGMEDEDLSVDEYWKSYTLDMTIDMLYDMLKDEKSAEEHGIDSTELEYYESILSPFSF